MINNQDDDRYSCEELYAAVYEATKAVRIITKDEDDSLRELLRVCSPLALAVVATMFFNVANDLAGNANPPLTKLIDDEIKSMAFGIMAAIADTGGLK